MGTVAGPLAAAGLVTPVKRVMGTILASTALTAPHGENRLASLLSQKGVTAVARPSLANSGVNSYVSVHVGSHSIFSALELRSPFVLPSQRQGLPSSGYSLCSPAVCPLRPVSQLTPINADRLQHELRHHPNPDKVAYVVQGLRDGFHLGFNYNTSLKSATRNMASALLNPQVIAFRCQVSFCMDWNNTVRILHIKFRHKGTPPKRHYARNVIYLHVLQRIILLRNSVVDTVASRARQVQDRTPFHRLVAFGEDAETNHREDREGRLGEEARHPACLNVQLQVIVDDLRV